MHNSPELSGGTISSEEQPINPYGVGIDCHSKFIAVCVFVQAESLVRHERQFKTTWPELTMAREWVLSIFSPLGLELTSVHFTIESTGCYHYPVIISLAGTPHVVNPSLASPTRRKTDTLDAKLLAYHAAHGSLARVVFPGSGCANAAGSFASPAAVCPREEPRTQWRQQRATPVWRDNCRVGVSFGGGAASGRRGYRFGCRTPRAPIRWALCSPPIARQAILDLYTAYDRCKAAEFKHQREAISFAKSISWETGSGTIRGSELFRLLLTVPGVGEVTALTWLGEVCETKRFPNAKALAAFCGCDPSLKVSAGKVTAMVRRKGNAGMKRALIQAAQMLLTRRSEAFGRWGFSIYKRRGKGGWFKAVGAVARRIAQALYWVHRKGEVFSYAQYELLPPYSEVPGRPLCSGVLSQRTVCVLASAAITTARAVYHWMTESSVKVPGFGPAASREAGEWLRQVLETLRERREPRYAGHRREGYCSKAASSVEQVDPSALAKSSTPSTRTRSSRRQHLLARSLGRKAGRRRRADQEGSRSEGLLGKGRRLVPSCARQGGAK